MQKEMTSEEFKNAGLSILKEIDRVCSILNIKYYLATGTLLGAIRHNGYIPWDDDLDIWMTKKDYDILFKEFNKLASSDYKILSWENDDNYPYYAPKVVYLKTDVKERWTKKKAKDLGVWVDIFCLNSISSSLWNSYLKDKMCALEKNRRLAQFRYMCFFSKLDLLLLALKNRKTVSLKAIFKKPKFYTEQIYALMKESEEEESEYFIPTDELISGRCCFKKSWFSNAEYHKFESAEFLIPSNSHEILKILYGDYMTPPKPRDRRISQHIAYAFWKDERC